MKKELENIKPVITPIMFIGACISFYYIDNVFLGSILIVIYILFILSGVNNKRKHKSSIEELKFNIDEAISENMLNLIFPLVLINRAGDIVWKNTKFEDILKKDASEANIISVATGLELSRLIDCDKDFYQKIKIENSLYKVYSQEVSINNKQYQDNIYAVYFNNMSEFNSVDSTKESIILIEVDNLVEVLETTLDADKPMLVAEVERDINAYAHKLKAMITKYDTNKYVFSVQDKYINQEIKCKFSILESISKIDRGNKLEVTLSIGIGRGGISPQENYNFASAAKELALGRGGDQAAVKNNDKIIFFGGNTREIEKRTRVRARVIAHALKGLIYESSNVFIVGHKSPDMDCFGSAIGIASVVRQLGKPCNIVLNNDINAIEYYLNKIKEDSRYNNLLITSEEANKQLTEKSLVIVVDVHNKSYAQEIAFVEKAHRKVIIDHHRRSPDIIEGAILTYIEVYASSTAEMVTELIQYMVEKPKLSKNEAEGLLAGIFMDTKGFSFKAGVRTFDAASFLRGLGADTIEVKKMFTDDLEDYLMIADTIRSAEVEDGIAIAVAPERLKESFMVARSADELLSISGIKVSFVLAKINDEIIVSGRSIGDINVQIILEAMGGGGHMNMAGTKLTNTTIESAIEQLKDAITKKLRMGE
ncbi:DHH family phosphoesterase [Clostridium gasigenes]|uniref:Cyclic-di-AMP phosphodiesterase n=1 Tax=Clostridium gasigenes TaxID=94869 RepID=A0A1H0V5R5_9CLOT|nr:DHH family phosphoesterase [Clostridium gasigenes]MBU3090076.1 DHH family phosphoesterase [Clostridium gasigenes]MBU3105960.1 DHH family phosphoesterase [Clostridium gasigenes]SDP73790.1 c-di-AMP phosphodiesterase, consists of a GGDEF-like and DHH domains [Clostridium gasigenes]